MSLEGAGVLEGYVMKSDGRHSRRSPAQARTHVPQGGGGRVDSSGQDGGHRGGLDRTDLAFWGLTWAAALIIFTLVYAAAFRLPPRGYSFSGFIHSSHDMYSYQAWAEAFARDGFLVDNPYSNVVRPGAYFNLYWYPFGKLMKLTGLPFRTLLYLAAGLGGGMMYLSFLAFMREFLAPRAMAWFAYLLAGFGSGFGWILTLLSGDFFGGRVRAQDINSPEAIPFHDFLSYPHVALSFGFMALVYLWFYRGVEERRWRWVAAAGSAAFLLGFFHPYHLLTILAVTAVFFVAMAARHGRDYLSRWPYFAFLAAATVPPLAYFRFYLLRSENFKWWGTQIYNETYGLPGVLLGFGPGLLLAAFGVPALVKGRRLPPRLVFLLGWVGVTLVLAFSGSLLKFASRILQGFVLPLSALAAVGFGSLYSRLAGEQDSSPETTPLFGDGHPSGGASEDRPPARFLVWSAVAVLMTMPSHAMNFGNQLRMIAGKEPWFQPPYNSKIIVSRGEAEAFDFLKRNMTGDPAVMSNLHTGVALPGIARVRSFVGHLQGTPANGQKLYLMETFFSRTLNDGMRWAILEGNGIDYLYFGPDEAGGGYRPSGEPYLQPVFDNGVVRIFKVLHRPGYRKPS